MLMNTTLVKDLYRNIDNYCDKEVKLGSLTLHINC